MTQFNRTWALGLGLVMALALCGAPGTMANGDGAGGNGLPDGMDADRGRDEEQSSTLDATHDGREADDRDDSNDSNDRDGDNGDDGDDDRGRDSGRGRDEQRRAVAVRADDERIEIELKRQQNGTEDKVEVSFDFEDAEFETKFESEDAVSELELKLEATFQALIEYRDSNSNGRYDPGEELVSAWALGDDDDLDDLDVSPDGRISWGVPSTQQVTADGQTGHRITAPAELADGRFELVFTVFGDFAQIDQATLRPTSVKVDILIEDYPYQEGNTALALILETKSSTEFEHERDHEDMDDDEQGVAATALAGELDVTLAFVWKDHANVDGTQRPVGTTLLESKQETEAGERQLKERFALSYERGQQIVHDPETWVSLQSRQTSQQTPGLGLALAIAIVGAAALARRNRNSP